jgi:hypothetical protein
VHSILLSLRPSGNKQAPSYTGIGYRVLRSGKGLVRLRKPPEHDACAAEVLLPET